MMANRDYHSIMSSGFALQSRCRNFATIGGIYFAVCFVARLAGLENRNAFVVDYRHDHTDIFLVKVFSKKAYDRLVVVGLFSIQ
jgi:hypothetical protein